MTRLGMRVDIQPIQPDTTVWIVNGNWQCYFVKRPETGELWACSLPKIDDQIKLSWIGKVPSYTTYDEYFKEDDVTDPRYMTDDEKNTLYKLYWHGQVI